MSKIRTTMLVEVLLSEEEKEHLKQSHEILNNILYIMNSERLSYASNSVAKATESLSTFFHEFKIDIEE